VFELSNIPAQFNSYGPGTRNSRGVPLGNDAKQEAQLTRAEADWRNAATRCNGLLPCRRRQWRRRAVVGRPGRLGSGRLADDPQSGDKWRVG
jgi:hypothetical protein